MMSPEGIIGQSALGCEDLMARHSENVFALSHEAFVMDPKTHMMELYEFIGKDYFEHDFENIENVATELDSMYLNKFPHEGSGKVRKAKRTDWKNFVPDELGNLIHQRFPKYNSLFGY